MADDGRGFKIVIPSIFIRKEDSDVLTKYIEDTTQE